MTKEETLIVGSRVKEVLRSKEVKVGEGSLDALNSVVHWYLMQAALRAEANGRKTIRAHDFIVMEAYGK